MQIDARLGPSDAVVEGHPGPTFRADALGRWISYTTGRGFVHRTMDGAVVRRAGRRAVELTPGERDAAHEGARAVARQLLADLDQAEVGVRHGTVRDLAERLRRVEDWTIDRHAGLRERFDAIYPEPVTIMPPDRYRDIVISPATGCPNASCTFCAFYQGQRFRRLSDADFRAHINGVVELFGPVLPQRDGVFLGSASALSLSQRRMLQVLALVMDRLGPRKRGIATFLDPDHTPRRDASHWAELREAGLDQVVVGLETGLSALRAKLNKGPDVDRLVDAVRQIKTGGLRVGVTVLAGVGGVERAVEQGAATADALAVMELDPGDLIYLSPLRGSMLSNELRAESARLRGALGAATAARVVPYSMDLFRYYA